jgi:hypothetical protein
VGFTEGWNQRGFARSVDTERGFLHCRGHSVCDRFEVVLLEAPHMGTSESDLRRNVLWDLAAGETSGRRELPELDLDADLLSAAQYSQCDCVTWLMTADGFRERRLALEGLGVDGGDDVLLPESGRCSR